MEFNLLTNERRKELIKEIQATGIVVEATSSLSEQGILQQLYSKIKSFIVVHIH